MARIRSADEISRRPEGPVRGPPETRAGESPAAPSGRPDGGPPGAAARRTGWPDGGPPGAAARRTGWPDGGPPGAAARRTGWPPCPVCPAWGRFAGAGVVAVAGVGEDGRGLGAADAGLAPERGCSLAAPPGPILGGAGGRAACAATAGPVAGDGARAGGEASTCPGLAPASTRCGPACAAPDCGTVGAVPDEPGRTVPGGLRLTTTVRRGFFTTTIRRRSSPASAAGRCAATPSGDAGAAPAGRSSARDAAGATIFCSGLRFIRVARGRGFSSVSGRSVEGLGDAVVFSSLILNKYNSRVESIRQANHSCQSCRLATRARRQSWSYSGSSSVGAPSSSTTSTFSSIKRSNVATSSVVRPSI